MMPWLEWLQYAVMAVGALVYLEVVGQAFFPNHPFFQPKHKRNR